MMRIELLMLAVLLLPVVPQVLMVLVVMLVSVLMTVLIAVLMAVLLMVVISVVMAMVGVTALVLRRKILHLFATTLVPQRQIRKQTSRLLSRRSLRRRVEDGIPILRLELPSRSRTAVTSRH